jgi:hypothetical protein
MNKDIAYEVAMQRLQNREKELVEILALYNEALVKIKELEKEIERMKNEKRTESEKIEKKMREELNSFNRNN